MKVLIIDNYDSFTFNLYQYVGEILENTNRIFQLDVIRNDEKTLEQIQSENYNKIIISPGPGDPKDKEYFGVCSEVITNLGKTIPVLGVCLGMQGIAHYFGGKVVRAVIPKHGKTSIINHDSKGVFKNLPQGIEIMRYHSLIVEKDSLPSSLEITAETISKESGLEVMGIRHKDFPIEGIQFHPESFATEGGKKMLENFLLK
jgi:anthranilate synthase component 2